MGKKTEPIDHDVECCVTDLETLKGQLAEAPPAVQGAADGDAVQAPAAVTPGQILVILDVILKLIERFRKK